ncbi:MAG: hypothetical protein ACRDQ0_22150, partial [Pseudonocardia sp.]
PSTADGDRTVFWTHDGQWAVRRGRFKRVHHPRDGMAPPHVLDHALFDLADDPGETTDVSVRFPAVAADLDGELARFRGRHGGWAARTVTERTALP